MEIFIDYGNGKRLIESCSGMEKTISSIAIRSALSNISVLPKCDFLILDEGFGTLDSVQVETCNRLLQSLKKYYKCIFIITHVDSMKEIMDQMIEIGRDGDDSYVNVS
jgi:exonuclease SbcC